MADRISEIDSRTTALENSEYRLKVWLSVLSALGFVAGAIAFWLWGQANALEERISSAASAVNGLERRISEIDAEIEEKVSSFFENDLLIAGYNQHSVLAQVQAQAICTAIAPKSGGSVRAVFRRSILSNGRPQGLHCSETCNGVSSFGGRTLDPKKVNVLGAVHIYANSSPVSLENPDTPVVGLNTFLYSSWERSSYGPNYCCCGHE